MQKTIIDEIDRVIRRYGTLLGMLTAADVGGCDVDSSNKTRTKRSNLVVDAVDLNAGADVALLEKLLCEPRTNRTRHVHSYGDSDALNPNEDRDNTVPLDRGVHARHMDEEDSPEHSSGCEFSLNDPTDEPVGVCTSAPLPPLSGPPATPLVDLINDRLGLRLQPQSTSPSQSPLEITNSAWLKAMVDLTRRVFYEGQVGNYS